MFAVFAFLAILFSTLPVSSAVNHPNSDFDPEAVKQISNFSSPTGVANAFDDLPNYNGNQNLHSSNDKPESNLQVGNRGQAISEVARAEHDGGISDQVHEIILSTGKHEPTPTPTIVVPTPTPEIIDYPVYPIDPPFIPPYRCHPVFITSPDVSCPELQ